MSTDLVLVDSSYSRTRDAVMRRLNALTSTPDTTRSDTALKAALDALAIPNEWCQTGGGCTARDIVFDPDPNAEDHALNILVTYDASVDHYMSHHGGWAAAWYGPEMDSYPNHVIYGSWTGNSVPQQPTFADIAHDSAQCAQAIRRWYDGIDTTWTRNEVTLEGLGPYRCETRSEHWDGYCAPRFTREVMEQISRDTQTAHRLGTWNAPISMESGTAVIRTPHSTTEVRPDRDGYYRPGAFYWPWTEHTTRDLGPIRDILWRLHRTRYKAVDSYTVVAADEGWRVKVIDVLRTPDPKRETELGLDLYGALWDAALASYEVNAEGPGEAEQAVRDHFRRTRSDRDPDAQVQTFDCPGVQLPQP
ncbi:hypothetical protein OIE69_44275 (plasmid) [Actinacidiphila glaucinigra]|uniref:hypothetical protein n=1 Tax=Actinacidiphila glaucinigra TaxID=235986 RepID=UPI002DDC2A9A|nr:hypothetical protein [Actinacidiphila glaucinigra]WSD65922.1 hypothetical protein OIE69_44275 [Actinacidiphila glaucinigra]